MTNDADWLLTSASSGTGTTPITVSTLSANDSSTPRTATITITCDNEVAIVNITQLAAYSSNNSVDFSDPFVMNNSVAFTYSIGSEVSYFYTGYLSASAVAWTDERIVNELTESDRFEPNDTDVKGLTGFGGMHANTTYYLCAIAFDKKGNRGELTKTKITTLPENVNDPWVDFENVNYSDESWIFYMHKNPFAHQFYQVVMDGEYSYYWYSLFTDAEIAYMMKELIDQNSIFPFTNDSDPLLYNRTPGATEVYSAVWAQSGQFAFSPQLNKAYRFIESSKSTTIPAKVTRNTKKVHFTPASDLEKMKKGIKFAKI